MIGSVSVDFEDAKHTAVIMAEKTYERTGVEMEALTACSVAALTIYDMVNQSIKAWHLDLAVEKTGGKIGSYIRN